MKVLVTGGTGALGKELVWELLRKQHDVIVLTRKLPNTDDQLPYRTIQWPIANNEDEKRLIDVDAVIHLAGESLMAGRWTSERKEAIYKSRINMTAELVGNLKKSTRLSVLLSASAIGFYGDRKTELLTEDSNKGEGFLADVCDKWEKEANHLKRPGLRVVNLRTGVVLDRNSGFLKQVEPIYQMRAGGPIGSGNQMLSWIHITDWVNAVVYLLESKTTEAAYNLVAPEPVSNKSFSHIYGKIFNQSFQIPTPGFALKVALGEMSSVALDSQNVRPKKLSEELGFKFIYPYLKEALENIYELEKFGGGVFDFFKSDLWVNKPIVNTFEFFSDEMNLEKLTPDFLNFKVLQKSTEKISKGTLIDYSLKIHGMPAKWQTKIEEWQPPNRFVDTQLKGPYSVWHHTHIFESVAGGTLMTDRVHYKLPLKMFGRTFALWLVKKDVSKIFSYRTKVLRELWARN